jgi:enoyl-CoA hydratase/long-chain 3-hydroxyacyl-CoA dehydrogenase
MMAEVLALAMEGVEAERLDKSLKKFGWPVGAITLADEVGIDVAGHVHSFLSQVWAQSVWYSVVM